MFWTKWVRGLTKVFLGVGAVASLIGAIAMSTSSYSGRVDVIAAGIYFLVCMVVLISIVAFVMIITEISVSAHEINEKLNSLSNPNLSNSMTSLEKAPQTSQTLNNMNTPYVNSGGANVKYCVKCGTTLDSNVKFCLKCGSSQ